MKQFLLLLKGKKELDYSPDQLQKRLEEYRSWVRKIHDHYESDNRLERRGVHLKNEKEILTDGPFLDAKEIIAGFIMIKAESLEEATKIAQGSPLLQYFEILVRPVV